MPAAGGVPPVGPFPPGVESEEEREAYDKLRRRVLWSLPSGLYVLGSAAGGRRNLMTVNLVTQVATSPKLVGASVLKEALTHRLVTEGGAFALSVVDREDRAIVRRFVKPVDEGPDGTLNGFAVSARRTGAPVLDQAVAYLDCEVRQAVDAGDHTFFVGEVVDAGFLKDEATPVLRMEDTRMNYGG